MAADTELIKVDYIEKETWDTLLNGGGGSGLPDVTSADNGKLLGVSSGKWQKVDAPAADSGELLVTFAVDNDTVTADVTVAEIIAAAQAGTPIRGKIPQGDGYAYIPLIYADSTTVLFTALSYGQSGFIQNGLIGSNAGETDTWQLNAG